MSKSITIFTEVYSPEDFRINEIVEFLKKKYHVTIITRVPSYPKGILFQGFANRIQKEICDNVIIYRYPIFLDYDRYKIRKVLNLLWQPIALSFAYARIRPKNIFIFQTGSLYQYLFLIFVPKSKPVVLWSQDLWPEAGYHSLSVLKLLDKVLKKVTRTILKSSNTLVVQSNAFAEHYLSNYCLKSLVIPNFSPVEMKKNPNITRDTNLLYAGNIGSAQNLDQLILFFIKIRKNLPTYFTRFDIYGDGSELQALKTKYSQSKDIFFHGRIPRIELDGKVIKSKFVCLSLPDSVVNKTIPGRFQYFYNMGCNILYLGKGEVKHLIESTQCGLVLDSTSEKSLAEIFNNFDLNNHIYRKDIFNQSKILLMLHDVINSTFFSHKSF